MPSVSASDAQTSPNYIIDQIFPCREVHLIAGSSGSGKTTLLIQLLQDWIPGNPVYGFQSFPVPFIYVSCDRSMESVSRTMSRVGFDFPQYSVVDRNLVGKSVTQIIQSLRPPLTTRLMILDGMTSLCPDGKINDHKTVANFIANMTQLCQIRNMTIIGTVHTTKTRENEKILKPRERITGSTAWAAYSETICVLEPVNATDDSSRRTLDIMPRNGALIHRLLEFSPEGRLVEVAEADPDATGIFLVEQFLDSLPSDQDIPTGVLLSYAEGQGIPIRTMERWISGFVKFGRLVKVKQGIFHVTPE